MKHAGKPVPALVRLGTRLFGRLVYNKIRERLGGEMKLACSGAAPLSKELGEFYASIGMPLIEGYGLTEGGVATLNPPDRPKPGSIGKPLPGIEVRLTEDGELLIKSPCLFSGYYKDPVSTAAVLKDGWLYTGDIAEIDSEGYIHITGRKKELIVSSNGKKIYPARIESLFKSEPLINQMLLIGDKLPYVTALFTINAAAVENLKGLEEITRRKEQARKAHQPGRKEQTMMVPFSRQMPTVIRPSQITPDVTYEPPLRVGFGINDQNVAGAQATMGRTVLVPGAGPNPTHYHAVNDVCWYILSGRIRAWFARSDGSDRQDVLLEGGDFVYIPSGAIHVLWDAAAAAIFWLVRPGGAVIPPGGFGERRRQSGRSGHASPRSRSGRHPRFSMWGRHGARPS